MILTHYLCLMRYKGRANKNRLVAVPYDSGVWTRNKIIEIEEEEKLENKD